MTREDALRRVRLLRAVTEQRGATPNEARVAREKAAALEERFGVRAHETRERTARSRVWQAPQAGGAWSFDMTTGQTSGNVKVHRYRNRLDWRIEVPFP